MPPGKPPAGTLNPDSEVSAGSAGHQPGNIINHGFRLRLRLELLNKNMLPPWVRHCDTVVYGRFRRVTVESGLLKLKMPGWCPALPGSTSESGIMIQPQ